MILEIINIPCLCFLYAIRQIVKLGGCEAYHHCSVLRLTLAWVRRINNPKDVAIEPPLESAKCLSLQVYHLCTRAVSPLKCLKVDLGFSRM